MLVVISCCTAVVVCILVGWLLVISWVARECSRVFVVSIMVWVCSSIGLLGVVSVRFVLLS